MLPAMDRSPAPWIVNPIGVGHVVGLVALMLACETTPGPPSTRRYVVTSVPIHIGGTGIRQCVGVDPADPGGVWVWSPGRSGCSTRSTGPTVFRAEGATVVPSTSDLSIGFKLQLIPQPGQQGPVFVSVQLTIDGGVATVTQSGERVPVHDRIDLELPEEPPGR